MKKAIYIQEFGTGYTSLFVFILGSSLVNTVALGVSFVALVQGAGWSAVVALGYVLATYLGLYVVNVVGKAVLISRDLAIDRQRAESAKPPSTAALMAK